MFTFTCSSPFLEYFHVLEGSPEQFEWACSGSKKEIEFALKNYGTGNSDYIDYKIVKEEYSDVMSIVAQLQTDNLCHCLIVKHLKKIFEKGKVDFDNEIIDKFIKSPKSIIYSIFF